MANDDLLMAKQDFLPFLEMGNPLPATSQSENYDYVARGALSQDDGFHIHSRRYIGNKYKLLDWIFSIIHRECKGDSFADIFAGTGVVAMRAVRDFRQIIINDFLYSNYAIYKAFFGQGQYDYKKMMHIIDGYNDLEGDHLEENYFSTHFSGKYFTKNTARLIGYIRGDIECKRMTLTAKEYYFLLASLIYASDKIANTTGHYDAYIKKPINERGFVMKPIIPCCSIKDISIFRNDANQLVRKIKADVTYIDPPYNSRQYSRFYHLLETLIKWDKPKLYGTALKPLPENTSEYCRIGARHRFSDLISNLETKYIVVSYNNTYVSKSSSSKNKITLEQITSILEKRGKTKIFETGYRHFTTGRTDFENHKECCFVTYVG